MLKNLKLFLGIEDNSIDEKLKLIISNATARLQTLLGGTEPPEELEHIILEASVNRFNRIGSEGMKSHSVEGETITFSEDDFAEFKDEIQAYIDTQTTVKRGKVRFI